MSVRVCVHIYLIFLAPNLPNWICFFPLDYSSAVCTTDVPTSPFPSLQCLFNIFFIFLVGIHEFNAYMFINPCSIHIIHWQVLLYECISSSFTYSNAKFYLRNELLTNPQFTCTSPSHFQGDIDNPTSPLPSLYKFICMCCVCVCCGRSFSICTSICGQSHQWWTSSWGRRVCEAATSSQTCHRIVRAVSTTIETVLHHQLPSSTLPIRKLSSTKLIHTCSLLLLFFFSQWDR